MGAPPGNQNAVKAKRFMQAIDRALEKKSRADGIAALDDIAEKIVDAVMKGPSYEKGDVWLGVVTHIADRIDGKPSQPLEHSGDLVVNLTPQDANL